MEMWYCVKKMDGRTDQWNRIKPNPNPNQNRSSYMWSNHILQRYKDNSVEETILIANDTETISYPYTKEPHYTLHHIQKLILNGFIDLNVKSEL